MTDKKLIILESAQKELVEFSERVQLSFEKRFSTLRIEGRLEYPDARKLTEDLFEIRIKVDGAYRSIYAYFGKEQIIIVHCFQKKTQKTPGKHIKLAERRLLGYAQT